MDNLPQANRPVQIVCGPLLRYIEIDYQRRLWRGSCLIVINSAKAPSLTLSLRSGFSNKEKIMEPVRVETIEVFRNEYYFWRYELLLPLINEPQTVSYTSDCFPQDQQAYLFHLAAIQDSMRFMFYSCSGFSNIPQEIKNRFGEKTAPLWADVLDRHEVYKFNIMIGGGDQLYQDRLIYDDFMKPWMNEKDPKKRLAMKLPKSMQDGFEHFYFWNYIKNFGFKDSPVQAQAYASIPSVNMWDDHDIIDGYGSYPADMQSADCFQVLFANASRFYYAFQQHTSIERAERDAMIRGTLPTCNHIVTTLGPDIGLLALDARGERTKFTVCTSHSYDVVFDAMHERIPPTVRHFLVLTGIPIIYPRLTLFEKAMEGAASLNLSTLVGRAGVLGDIIAGQLNEWNGDPELLDDMNDHWNAVHHEEERREFIKRLQLFAKEKSMRISLLGGDVHCCGTGQLYSKDMQQKEEGDPYLMVQIISSAIVNVPPPQILLSILNSSSPITFDNNVEERMYDLFRFSPNGNPRQNQKLMGMRNYCAGYYDKNTGEMNFWIQAEAKIGEVGTKGYLITAPRLVFGDVGQKLHSQNVKQYLLKASTLEIIENVPDSTSGKQPSHPTTKTKRPRQHKRQIKRFFQNLLHTPFISYLIHN